MKAIPDARDIPLRYFAFEASKQSLGAWAWIIIILPLLYQN
jgi:hypothetical protein